MTAPSTLAALIGAFFLGVSSAASPCLLPLYPGFVAYMAANATSLEGRRATGLLGMIVLAGVLTTALAIGVAVTVIAMPVSRLLSIAVPVIDVILIVLGLALFAGWNPFERVPGIGVPMVTDPFARAYVYGLFVGPLALPCVGVFLVALLAISVSLDEAIARVVLFLVYGLGFGFPLVVLSLIAATRGQALSRVIVAHHRAIERAAGAILIVVGSADLLVNWDAIRGVLTA